MGALRLVGAFEIERRTGHRWSIGGLILGGLELGTGILLITTDTLSRGVMITIGTWALPSTLLIVEAFRARGLARLILEGGPRPQNVRIGVPRPGTLRRSLTQVMSLSGGCALHARLT